MNIKKIIFSLLTAVLLFAACKDDNNGNGATDELRQIVYAIGSDENRQTLTTDAEWDALLNHFLDCAAMGDSVKFYNLSDYPNGTKGVIFMKEAVTISTTSRDEIKEWMRHMEREGKTVSISYDERTGTWNGTAYATMPEVALERTCYTGTMECVPAPAFDGLSDDMMVPALRISDDTLLILVEEGSTLICGGEMDPDTVTICGRMDVVTDRQGNEVLVLDLSAQSEGALVGAWKITSMTVSQSGCGDPMLNTTLYIPAENSAEIYTFDDDGTVTLVRTSPDGTTTTSDTWSISDDNGLCCDLLPAGGGCWNINWLTSSSMILSRETHGTENGDALYHLCFEAVGNAK
ncbi:MAG: hypothetical protein IKN84_07010 [Bacteroidales bacterium]|nr:hypothetical protein [Bacteroidales bacterium]